jgi:hypothetical protein
MICQFHTINHLKSIKFGIKTDKIVSVIKMEISKNENYFLKQDVFGYCQLTLSLLIISILTPKNNDIIPTICRT